MNVRIHHARSLGMTNAVPFLMKMSEVIDEIMSGMFGVAGRESGGWEQSRAGR